MIEHGSMILFVTIVAGGIMACSVGANDVANAMGTAVGSRSLSIRQALWIAAIFEALGAIFASGPVTHMLRDGLFQVSDFQDDQKHLVYGMLASLFSAATWLFAATWNRWPVSTTHTIVGAILGFVLVSLGIEHIQLKSLLNIIFSWTISPLIAAAMGYILMRGMVTTVLDSINPRAHMLKVLSCYVYGSLFFMCFVALKVGLMSLGKTVAQDTIFIMAAVLALVGLGVFYFVSRSVLLSKNQTIEEHQSIERVFQILTIMTAGMMAFSHGANDVANAIGPVAMVVDVVKHNGMVSLQTPLWLGILGAIGITIGLWFYGYRIIETVGNRITYLTPSRSFCAQLTTAIIVLLATVMGFPVSTTQILVGAVVGVGLAGGIAALNTGVIKGIFLSWAITLPAGAGLSVMYYSLINWFFG